MVYSVLPSAASWFPAWLIFYVEDEGDMFPLKKQFTYRLHGTMSQKTATFIVPLSELQMLHS
jgi:hypothetical protein